MAEADGGVAEADGGVADRGDYISSLVRFHAGGHEKEFFSSLLYVGVFSSFVFTLHPIPSIYTWE